MLYTPRWTSKFQVKGNSWVFVPTDDTVEYGSSVKKSIEKKWIPPNTYYHLRNGGHVEALKSHLGNKYFIHVDIENYFGSINKSRVTRSLKRLFSYKTSREIAVNSTVRLPNNHERRYILPFGFVQSPIIASLVLFESKLGRYLLKINKYPENIVSIYVDDIIVSSDNQENLRKILHTLHSLADKSKLPLNHNKTEGPSDKITAFNIELSKQSLVITKERFDLFQETYLMAKNEKVREGILSYTSSVNINQSTILFNS